MTGSKPPGWKGWHLAILRTDNQTPFNAPYLSIAWTEYSEQEGTNRQLPGNSGEIRNLYSFTNAISIFFIHESGKCFRYHPVQIGEPRFGGSRPGNDHEVEDKRPFRKSPSHRFPQTPPDPVSDHRTAGFFAYGESEPAEFELARQGVYHKIPGRKPPAGFENPSKVPLLYKRTVPLLTG